jgi:hypothetical protein
MNGPLDRKHVHGGKDRTRPIFYSNVAVATLPEVPLTGPPPILKGDYDL